MPEPGRVVVVTGTGTGVGKTIATAALAVRAGGDGSVVVVKPVQTGVGPASAESGDAEVVHALTGCAVQEFTSLDDPLAPDTAARLRDVAIPPVREHADRIRVLAEFHDTVIVEGAGGLLVRLDTDGGTLLDMASELSDVVPVEVVVVVAAGLGTLNHTELTVAALRSRGLEPVRPGHRRLAHRARTGRAVQPRRPVPGDGGPCCRRHSRGRGLALRCGLPRARPSGWFSPPAG